MAKAAGEPILHAKALAWGGSIGIRISKAEARRLGIRPGQELDLKVMGTPRAIDFSKWQMLSDPGLQSTDLDPAIGEAYAADLDRSRVPPRGRDER